ncbi:DUF4331 family protein [Sphingomicrobium sp. XHP0239]|uniref:DUF4331 family protein n=1 Tax=Sphingomicrobium maritimum TaxID=3133972 RepID=UPI0031CCD652
MKNPFSIAARTLVPLMLIGGLAACSDSDDNEDVVVVPPQPDPGPGPQPTGFDVTPCLEQEIPGTGLTVAEAVVPDTLTINFSAPSGFPNGRALPDPVIDVTLAVIFLDLMTHDPTAFFELPLNPPANDVSFRGSFPFLANAQGMPPRADTSGSGFSFNTQADSAYDRVDRMGMPAVSTALIPTDTKVPYNDANPAIDATGEFVPEIAMVLTDLTNALADDLTSLGFQPCAVPAGS